MLRFRIFAACLLLACLSLPSLASAAAPPPLVVFAAASLKTAVDDVAAVWRRETGQSIRIAYAGTSALARQVEQGAPADLFMSADLDWMRYLSDRGLTSASRVLLGNQLVLVAPRSSPVTLTLAENAPLAAALGNGRLAVANVRSVPAGRYAKAALESLGLWTSVAGRLAQTSNVREALRLVARGETPLGIVYATDAHAEPAVKIVDTFADATHPPIRYPVAIVHGSTNPLDSTFLDFLSSPAARRIFEREGFTVLAPSPVH